MCGIVGIVRSAGAPVTEEELRPMAAAMAHRGPDEGGSYTSPGVGLGIRRLKVIDLVTGSQPVSNEDGSVWAVLNGEIYNFQSLREELHARGHRFRTQSDTECLVHAYEAYGEECVQHLRGMFAFALWDARARRLLLARDRLGKKPLVYAHLGSQLVFASELQALWHGPLIPRDMDLSAFGDYVAYGYVPAPASIYQAVRKVPPGHRLIWQEGQVRLERYWRLTYVPKWRLSETEAVQELERRLTEAVRLRLIADVPLGALLSGGIDSGTIVALMARLSPGRVKTFSIGFDEADYDELARARRVAQRYGTEHHECIVRPDAVAVIRRLVHHYGEPYADSSAIPTYYVSQLARQHVTVALNGDGGDELFAGYDRYRAMWMAQWLSTVPIVPRWLPTMARAIGALPGLSLRLRSRSLRFLGAAALPPAQRYARWVSASPPGAQEGLLEPSVASAAQHARSFAIESAFETSGELSLTDQLLATDVATYLPNDLLVKTDIASMANALETRSPFLDHEVVEFSARLPDTLKLRNGVQQKYLLKRLAATLLPKGHVTQRKQGFGVPVGVWLRGPLRGFGEELLLSEQARRRGYFQPERVQWLWEQHQAGAADYTVPLWTVMMFELWHREVRDTTCPEPAASCSVS